MTINRVSQGGVAPLEIFFGKKSQREDQGKNLSPLDLW
jgi:hypothetical protein